MCIYTIHTLYMDMHYRCTATAGVHKNDRHGACNLFYRPMGIYIYVCVRSLFVPEREWRRCRSGCSSVETLHFVSDLVAGVLAFIAVDGIASMRSCHRFYFAYLFEDWRRTRVGLCDLYFLLTNVWYN